MLRALLTTLATKNLRLQILDHTLAPLPLEEDISGSCTIHPASCFFFFLTCCLLTVRVNCWSLDRVVHCQACQFLKGLDPQLVQAISR